MTNPIQYTSRDFESILADINSDPELLDKPDWWKRMIAGIGDVLSVWQNMAENQSYLRTATTRRAVADLCALIDYQLTEQVTSSGTLLFDVAPASSLPLTVQTVNLSAMTSGTIGASSKRFEARASLTVSSSTEVVAYGDWNVTTKAIAVASVFTTGEKVRVSTSGALPAGIVANTDYFVIYVSGTSIKLASTRAGAYAGTIHSFTTQGSGNHTLTRLSRAVTAYQQKSVASASIGISDGTTEWQEFRISQVGVILTTLAVTINGDTWTAQDTLVYSVSTDKHFKAMFDTDGTLSLMFGDGTYGAIPGIFDIMASYAYGGGAGSNVNVIGSVNAYAGSDANVTGVTNPVALTGGDDAQSITGAKRIAPMLLKARDRFVTTEDGQALALSFGGISLVKVIANVYGILSCKVIAVAIGGGTASPTVRTALQAYLIDRSILESMDVRVQAGTFTPVDVTSAAAITPGYTWATVQPYFTIAWKLFFTETGREIIDVYESYGIASAVTRINSIFSTSFVAADYSQMTAILDGLVRIGARNFEDVIQESDAYALIQGCVEGIDYMTISAPSFPITLSADEITQAGTMTLTEIP